MVTAGDPSIAPDPVVSTASEPPQPGPPQADQPEAGDRPEAGDTLETLLTQLRELSAAVAELTERIGRDQERATHRETIIDRLHRENQALKAGETDRILDPVLRDLIRLHDELERTAGSWGDRDGVTPTQVTENLESIALEIELILGRQGVDRFTATPGDRFDRREHQAIAALLADDAGLEGAIAQVLRSGFRKSERVIRPVEVKVFRTRPGAGRADPADGRSTPMISPPG